MRKLYILYAKKCNNRFYCDLKCKRSQVDNQGIFTCTTLLAAAILPLTLLPMTSSERALLPVEKQGHAHKSIQPTPESAVTSCLKDNRNYQPLLDLAVYITVIFKYYIKYRAVITITVKQSHFIHIILPIYGT